MEDQAPLEQQAQLLLQFQAIVGQVHASFYLACADKVEPILEAVSREVSRARVDTVNLQSNRKIHAMRGFYSYPEESRQSDAKEGPR